MIVQEYLDKPFLVDGFKCDMRIYVLVASCDPLRVFLYHDGLLRLATERYVHPNEANSVGVFFGILAALFTKPRHFLPPTRMAFRDHSPLYYLSDIFHATGILSLEARDISAIGLWIVLLGAIHSRKNSKKGNNSSKN